ncbi:hypothetical protein ANANG_G00248270, partial [Anguilla anguilla]
TCKRTGNARGAQCSAQTIKYLTGSIQRHIECLCQRAMHAHSCGVSEGPGSPCPSQTSHSGAVSSTFARLLDLTCAMIGN